VGERGKRVANGKRRWGEVDWYDEAAKGENDKGESSTKRRYGVNRAPGEKFGEQEKDWTRGVNEPWRTRSGGP